MEIHERLKALRLAFGLTQKELSEQLDVSTVSVRHWELGTKSPSMAAIVSLSQLYKISTDYLLGVSYEEERDNMLLSNDELILLSNYRVLDKYGKKAVDSICLIEKHRVELENNHLYALSVPQKADRYIPKYATPAAAGCSVPLDGNEFEMILADETIPKDADFAVRIQGDSMYPHIQDGDTVYVKKNCELSVGDIGIFSVDGAMYCKQYYIDNNGNLLLISTNPDLRHTNICVGADSGITLVCFGKVLLDYRVEIPNYILG